MKHLIIAMAGVALLAAPAFAQTAQSKSGTSATTGSGSGQTMPRLFVGQGITSGNAVYDCTGKYLGSDPDPNIRTQLLRQADPASCSGH